MRPEMFSKAIVLSVALLLAGMTQAVEMWEKGRHYKELPYPVATRDPSKIEVVKLFWYGCPHCYEFNNDYLPEWKKSFADDVDFHMRPATFPGWKVHAKAFFAADALGVLDKVNQPLFDAIVANPKKYKDVDDFKDIFTANGVSEEEYEKVFEASGFRKVSKVDEAIKKIDEDIKRYRVSGVPALIINGKYKVGVRDAGNFANMVKVANFLIDKEREAMSKGK
ncbi:MAG: thiol:disulfide interchange protein DsbA/DsbL [Oleiphilaceae bacterium]|nr:thiol:disulfide interchange protein DsbA/DsbL [Oleiphilaceae bacterium]